MSTLGRTLKNSLTNVKYLVRHRWIDERTRIIFIEFLTYSANTNIFNSVTVIFELSLSGYIRSVFDVSIVDYTWNTKKGCRLNRGVFKIYLLMKILMIID